MGWITISPGAIVGIAISVLLILLGTLFMVRISGLRSLAKMAPHDFVVTIAIGSILGATVTQKDPSLGHGLVAIAALLGFQTLYSWWRLRRSLPLLENTPLLLMRDGSIFRENLSAAQLSEADLWAKLRQANVPSLDSVRAVVLEVTGDVSVLHGEHLDPELLQHVRLSK